MIRAFSGKYIRFEDEQAKRPDHLIIVEILNRKMDYIQLVIMNETHLLLSTTIKTITEVSGYHRYIPITDAISPFGVGGLSKLPTDTKDGMLEGIALHTKVNYSQLAKNFGRGLLEMDNDYVMLLEQ